MFHFWKAITDHAQPSASELTTLIYMLRVQKVNAKTSIVTAVVSDVPSGGLSGLHIVRIIASTKTQFPIANT